MKNLVNMVQQWWADGEIRGHVNRHHLLISGGYWCNCEEGENYRKKRGLR